MLNAGLHHRLNARGIKAGKQNLHVPLLVALPLHCAESSLERKFALIEIWDSSLARVGFQWAVYFRCPRCIRTRRLQIVSATVFIHRRDAAQRDHPAACFVEWQQVLFRRKVLPHPGSADGAVCGSRWGGCTTMRKSYRFGFSIRRLRGSCRERAVVSRAVSNQHDYASVDRNQLRHEPDRPGCNNTEPAYIGPTQFTAATAGLQRGRVGLCYAVAGTVNGAIKCQQISAWRKKWRRAVSGGEIGK